MSVAVRQIIPVGVLAVVAATAVGFRALEDRPNHYIRPIPPGLFGATVPNVALEDASGRPVDLATVLGTSPALLVVVGKNDCLGCAGIPLEFKILNFRFPDLPTYMIGSGGDPVFYHTYFRENGLGASGFTDSRAELIKALGFASPPLALLLDSASRIVFVDTRAGADAAHFPISLILEQIAGSLSPATPHDSIKEVQR